MTWGNKLILVFIVFAAMMSVLVYKCMQQNFELVSKNYYDDELKYQETINGQTNAAKVSDIRLENTQQTLQIKLPAEHSKTNVKGTVVFYCAANSRFDRKISFETTNGNIAIGKEKLGKVLYTVKVSWLAEGTDYYTEKSLDLK